MVRPFGLCDARLSQCRKLSSKLRAPAELTRFQACRASVSFLSIIPCICILSRFFCRTTISMQTWVLVPAPRFFCTGFGLNHRSCAKHLASWRFILQTDPKRSPPPPPRSRAYPGDVLIIVVLVRPVHQKYIRLYAGNPRAEQPRKTRLFSEKS